MEIKIIKIKEKREEGSTRNQNEVLKYLSAEIFIEKSEIDKVKRRVSDP